MERRLYPRRESARPFDIARLRSGLELMVLNWSRSGLLVEASGRLCPGARVGVHLPTAEGRVFVRGWIVRCQVHTLSAERIVYRGAVAFDGPLEANSERV